MITLHTITNEYDDGQDIFQFLQVGHQGLLESTHIGDGKTLRQFLAADVIGGLPEEQDPRVLWVFARCLESGDVDRLLAWAERCSLREYPKHQKHAFDTRFGSWVLDSVIVQEPSLRELQDNVWASVEDFPKEDWKAEVEADAITTGYWEWVENMRDQSRESG